MEKATAGQLIKHIRLSLGLSQAKFAMLLGFTQPTVSTWENNERFPDHKFFIRMKEICGINMEESLKRENTIYVQDGNKFPVASVQWLKKEGYKIHIAKKANYGKRTPDPNIDDTAPFGYEDIKPLAYIGKRFSEIELTAFKDRGFYIIILKNNEVLYGYAYQKGDLLALTGANQEPVEEIEIITIDKIYSPDEQ